MAIVEVNTGPGSRVHIRGNRFRNVDPGDHIVVRGAGADHVDISWNEIVERKPLRCNLDLTGHDRWLMETIVIPKMMALKGEGRSIEDGVALALFSVLPVEDFSRVKKAFADIWRQL